MVGVIAVILGGAIYRAGLRKLGCGIAALGVAGALLLGFGYALPGAVVEIGLVALIRASYARLKKALQTKPVQLVSMSATRG